MRILRRIPGKTLPGKVRREDIGRSRKIKDINKWVQWAKNRTENEEEKIVKIARDESTPWQKRHRSIEEETTRRSNQKIGSNRGRENKRG